jgi:hypothetical protein
MVAILPVLSNMPDISTFLPIYNKNRNNKIIIKVMVAILPVIANMPDISTFLPP